MITLAVFVGTAAGALALAGSNHLGVVPTMVAVLVGGGAPAGLFLAWATYRLAADQIRPDAVGGTKNLPRSGISESISPMPPVFPPQRADLPYFDRATDPRTLARILAINDALDQHRIRILAKEWVLNDQLSSGGWGKRLSVVTSLTNGREPTNLERSEGGILTTFVSLSALRNYESKRDSFLSSKSSRSALAYLVARQGTDGGFGRFVESRSGTELMRGERHTAFALSALMDLGGPMKVISAGLDFLARRAPLMEWSDDASPSLLIAGLLNLHQRLRQKSATELNTISDQVHSWLNTFEPARLYSELSSGSAATPWAPLWKPYASHPDLLFDTAIRTISMLPRPLAPEIRPAIIRALEYISEYQCEGGIPYAPGRLLPDIGMSASLMSTLIGLIPLDTEDPNDMGRFGGLTDSLLDFVISNWCKVKYRGMLYSETMAYILMTGVSV